MDVAQPTRAVGTFNFRESYSVVNAHVDAKRCRGHARCLTIAPEAFEFIDDEDRAVVNDQGVARTNVALLLEAEEECPERAITVGTGTKGVYG